jgi:hypothetical protein
MERLLGRLVSFVPCFCYKKSVLEANKETDSIRGVVDYINKENGWFRVAYRAGETVQHECFKEADIGEAVTLVGHKKNR